VEAELAAAAVSTGEVKMRGDDKSLERCRGGGELLMVAVAMATNGVTGERIESDAGDSLGDASCRKGEGGASNTDGESRLERVAIRRGVAEPGASAVAHEASEEVARPGAKSRVGRCSRADISLKVTR
jgi:hypothetical protein